MEYILTEPFYNNGRLVGALIKNILNDFTCCTINDYFINNNLLSLEASPETHVPNNLDLHGGETLKNYCHEFMISIHHNLTPVIEDIVGAPLLPSYNYTRKYNKGVELLCHKDRAACELSVTLPIFYSGSEDEILYISPNSKEDSSAEDIIGFNITPGQAVLFFGSGDIDTNNTTGYYHWRDPVKNDSILQSFFHWVYRDGIHKESALEWINNPRD